MDDTRAIFSLFGIKNVFDERFLYKLIRTFNHICTDVVISGTFIWF